MSTAYGNRPIVSDGLVLCLDAANPRSYPSTGTTWSDLSGNGNNGTLVNGVAYSADNNGSLVFDGTNDYVDTTFTDNIVTTGFTFSFWFYGTKSTVHFPVSFFINADLNTIFRIERFSAGNNSIEFGHKPEGGGSFITSATELVSFNFPNNVWHYCTLVYDGNYKYIYKNGSIDVTSDPGQNLVFYSGAFLRIGARHDGLPFQGNMSQISLYNRALTAAEVAQNFNAMRGRYGI